MISKLDKIYKARACLIIGAVGDALGAPVEFMSNDQIRQTFGDTGIQFHAEAYGHKGAVTDDTQMTLMCADGLLNAYRRGSERGILSEYWDYTALSYIKWLETQGGESSHYGALEDWGSKTLYEIIKDQGSRAPGNTCISALSKMPKPVAAASNESKGCGTVMRVAPVGIFFGSLYGSSPEELEKVFREGMMDASITHGNVTAQHASGILAVIIALCLNGEELLSAAEKSLDLFGTPDVAEICKKAISLSKEPASFKAITSLGEGWIAEEALAMSLYCALQCVSSGLPSVDALRLAVNHGGDSDSTGAITGNLIGICLGMPAIPDTLLGEDTEVGTLMEILTIYGEELITRPPRVISNIH